MDSISSYNHVALGTASKPLIPNIIFKETVDSLNRGERDFYELVNEEYSFESLQQSFITNKLAGNEKEQ